MRNKRGELGTSTLIILIASIVVVLSLVFILFNQSQELASTSHKNVQFTESFISKGFDIIKIEGLDGRNNYFDTFYMTVNLLPDSAPIDFDQVQISIQTASSHVILDYRNGTPVEGAGGYETFAKEDLGLIVADYVPFNGQISPQSFVNLNFDVDGDGDSNDFVATCDVTLCDVAHQDVALIFNLSSAGMQYAWLNDTSGNLVDISPVASVPIDISYSPIGDANNPYGFVTTKDSKPAHQHHALLPANGYFIIYADPVKLAVDLDMDGTSDYVVLNDTHLRILPSSQKNSIDIDLGGDISAGTVALSIAQTLILDNGSFIGDIDISGSASNGIIPESTSVDITPVIVDVGFFQIEYLISSPVHLTNHLLRGEIAKIYLKSPQRLYSDTDVRFNIIIPNGVSFPVTAFTGHTIPAMENILLFPKII